MKLLTIGVLLAVTGAPALNGQDLPAWVLDSSRVKRHARESFQNIPNYTCQETIVRSARHTSEGSFQGIDTLHFQVASVAGKELLAPKGASRFEDVDPSRYVWEGPIGTGLFSGLVRNLFVHDNAVIGQSKEAPVQSRATLAFDFEMTAFRSGYTVQSISGSAVVGLRGTFWVDQESLDLLQIEDHAVEIPLALGMSDVDSTVTFAPVRVGSSVTLLPQSAETIIKELNGEEKKNATEFSGCHAYTVESVIDFGKP